VAAIRNRDLPIPERAKELHEIHDKEAGVKQEILPRTGQFRYKNIKRSTLLQQIITITGY